MKGCLINFLIPSFIEIPLLNANREDPDQTPHSAASDLGLHCLSMSHLWDARLQWVNDFLQNRIVHRSMNYKTQRQVEGPTIKSICEPVNP